MNVRKGEAAIENDSIEDDDSRETDNTDSQSNAAEIKLKRAQTVRRSKPQLGQSRYTVIGPSTLGESQ